MAKQSSLALLVGVLVVGCSVDAAQDAQEGEALASNSSNIVGGKKSGPAQDGAVLIINGNESCTGSLIAPNLVLTARHCVAEPNSGPTECVDYGPTVDASQMQFFVGADLSPSATQNLDPDAVGTKITVPKTSNMCGFDIALVELDQDLTQAGAKIVPVRFTPLADNEPTIAVGYGVDGKDQERPTRMQRATTVLGVGPKSISYKTKSGGTIPYDAPKGDVVTGESTCFGDSGGPLFDMQGNLVAVTSRGIAVPQADDDGTHGNGCVDEPSVFAGARFNEATIRAAAKAAGHELPPAPGTTPGTGTKPTPDTGDGGPGAAPSGATDAPGTVGGDTKASPTPGDQTKKPSSSSSSTASGDDDDDSSAKKKTTPAPAAAKPGLGCAAAPGNGAGDLGSVVGVVFAIAAMLRRRHRSGSSRS